MRSGSSKLAVFFIAVLLGGVAVFVVQKRENSKDHNAVEPNIIQQLSLPQFNETDARLLAALEKVVDKSTEAEIKKGVTTAEEARELKNAHTLSKEREDLLLISEVDNKCHKDNLSVPDCEERKKAAIADIEFNILPSEFPFRNTATLEKWREKRKTQGAAYELLFEELEICSGID